MGEGWKDTKGIPLLEIPKAVSKLEYGSEERIMFQTRFILGCRGSELDILKKSRLYGKKQYWKLGKNQSSWRMEELPDEFLQELNYYWENYPTKSDNWFGKSNNSFKRIFDRDIRPILGEQWVKKEPRIHNLQTEQFVYQMSGLRKDAMTLDFRNNWIKYNDANVALLMTQKRWKHKTPWMTAAHYIVEFERIGLTRHGEIITPADVLKNVFEQKKLLVYEHEIKPIIFEASDQKSILEFFAT